MNFYFMTDNGPVDMVFFDGYSVGDRLLEGVLFECRFKDDETIDVRVRDEDADYLNDQVGRQWIKRVSDYVNERDGDVFTCDSFQDKNGDDAWIESRVSNHAQNQPPKFTPIQITPVSLPNGMLSLRDLIEQKKKNDD